MKLLSNIHEKIIKAQDEDSKGYPHVYVTSEQYKAIMEYMNAHPLKGSFIGHSEDCHYEIVGGLVSYGDVTFHLRPVVEPIVILV